MLRRIKFRVKVDFIPLRSLVKMRMDEETLIAEHSNKLDVLIRKLKMAGTQTHYDHRLVPYFLL